MARLIIVTLDEREAKALIRIAQTTLPTTPPTDLSYLSSAVIKITKQLDRLKVRIPVKHV